LRQTAR